MAKFNPPENFSFDRLEEWPAWRQRFSRYRTATKLSKMDKEVQVRIGQLLGLDPDHGPPVSDLWCMGRVKQSMTNT
ncbi:uncharacterized protein K02A2.6-like [Tachysurus ichikawai]